MTPGFFFQRCNIFIFQKMLRIVAYKEVTQSKYIMQLNKNRDQRQVARYVTDSLRRASATVAQLCLLIDKVALRELFANFIVEM